jgi:hypothetical protein
LFDVASKAPKTRSADLLDLLDPHRVAFTARIAASVSALVAHVVVFGIILHGAAPRAPASDPASARALATKAAIAAISGAVAQIESTIAESANASTIVHAARVPSPACRGVTPQAAKNTTLAGKRDTNEEKILMTWA